MDVNPADGIADQLELMTRRQQQFERHLADSLSVDPAGLAVMEHLMREGQATPTELARQLTISTAAMTLVLDRLQAAGHVSRHPHPTDRRKVAIIPAADSVTSAEGLVTPLIVGVERVVGALNPQEQQVVSTFLSQLLSVYDEVLSQADAPHGDDPVRH